MRIAFGSKGLPLIECINPQIKKYRIRWDFQPYFYDDSGEQGVSFMEDEILHKPTLREVKNIVLKGYNAIVDETILNGFKWKGMPVWLSSENQFNYKAAYDLAFQTNGASLPTVFKFGTTEEPVYYKFDTLEELTDFYTKALTYINEQLAIGWYKKDSIDWSEYEKALNL
jgi:hypothetical protein